MYNLVMDFGGTLIKIALTQGPLFVVQENIHNHSNIRDLDEVILYTHKMLAKIGASKDEIKRVGISLPGIVDTDKKTMLSVNEKYQYSIGFDYKGWSLKHFGCEPFMDNDARLALLGEVGYGVAKEEKDAVMLILGTGVGTAAILNGQILRGKHYQAGILGGHFTLKYEGEQCNCGNVGCVEQLASSWSIKAHVMRHSLYQNSILKNNPIDFYHITQAYRRNDSCAKEIVKYCAHIWASCVVTLIHAYDPQKIILSGGAMKSADIFLPYMKKVIDKAWTYWGKPEIVIAKDTEAFVLKGLNFQLNNGDKK